jgi:molybdopterin-guanine dinucleotide biosynthesis protein B
MVLVVAAIGVSGSGKTTAIEYLIERFSEMGYRVGAVKHIHHKGFTIDTQGKNTWRFSQAGAKVVVAVSPEEVSIIRKTERELSDLNKILDILKEDRLDVAFIEGMHWLIAKRADIVKIVAAKDLEGLKTTLDSTAEPIIAITGLVAKTAEQKSFGNLPFVRVPEDGERIVEQILSLIEKSGI